MFYRFENKPHSHADVDIALVFSGNWAANKLMKEDNDGKILMLFRAGSIETVCALEYDEMMPFHYFLDKYA